MTDDTHHRLTHDLQASAATEARLSHDGSTTTGHGALDAILADSPLAVLLGADGHSRACIMGIRSGRSSGCICETEPHPVDDAAKAVGTAIRFARMGANRQIPIPPRVIAGLVDQVDAGNAAAILVWHWLARRGQIPARSNSRPKLRIVCERS
ncbi:MAG: hypothetical protein WBA88_20005 [Pseudaminobacter sp.]